jgi:hypothetical protein
LRDRVANTSIPTGYEDNSGLGHRILFPHAMFCGRFGLSQF